MTRRAERLVDAHGQLLVYGASLVTDNRLDLDAVGRWVTLGIYMHLLHRAQAVQRLAEGGYVDAAEPILRAISCATVNILAITSEESTAAP